MIRTRQQPKSYQEDETDDEDEHSQDIKGLEIIIFITKILNLKECPEIDNDLIIKMRVDRMKRLKE